MNYSLIIDGMSCASCSSRIEKKLSKNEHIKSIVVNLTTSKATLDTDNKIDIDDIIKIIQDMGYDAKLNQDIIVEDLSKSLENKEFKLILSAILSLPLLLAMFDMIFNIKYIPNFFMNSFFQLTLASVVQFYCGWQFYKGAYDSLKDFSANMDVLVAMGTTSAYIFSIYNLSNHEHLYFETSAILITLILLGKYLEEIAKGKTTEAITKLLNLSPKEAIVLRNGEEILVPINQVIYNDIVLIKAGSKIPVDGIVVEGESYIDESMVTGESKPIKKVLNSQVIGGTINGNSVIKCKATKLGDESFLSQIIKIVEEAQSSKASIQRIADVISGYFVPIVVFISFLVFSYWYFIGTNNDINVALINMIAVLVISCPCALGLATPTSIMVGTGRGALNGILFKGGEYLESMQKITTIVFDKTGTITQGKPIVSNIYSEDKDRLLQISASLEKNSEHPIAKAIINAFNGNFLEVKDIHITTGMGISGKIDGKLAFVGTKNFIQNNISDEIEENIENDISTLVYVAYDNKFLGLISISDVIKPDIKKTIAELKNRGIKIFMLTGDNEKSANYIASQVGIDNVIANVLPTQKAEKIKELQKKGEFVAMVGDGINDAPSLAVANIGISIGTGTDIAIESSDIILLQGDISNIIKAINLSQKTIKNIKQNLFWAFIYNIIGIPIAAAGFLNPIVAGTAMAFSSVSVVTNALRLKYIKIN